ncbi:MULTISPECIES: nitrite reductase small subunit NirD [unclassified Streptomyces]|uniref:nitrite reductase small subunit NirD n=1 Tax=unclassified Streptomyces TaxID=2593676 RepID=UPI002DDC32AF|nr:MULTISPECIES: nitrite reductase small subunit NirD [unclassified Streptomyces]WSA95266.1 nitrite reductase small subunit NirD [Streptomyces sp. NBC_01795]WSB79684.1 nitrite reductase small subunit NirD [Streptomyces sp. NBC_01775]WSS12113.1 nitrite reductase small subunit NirD [Streptomyces sp. NBC_01186]WSS40824.1 nitrite reductase small subunit NirD [Streptomyces sp. NBC_01187]
MSTIAVSPISSSTDWSAVCPLDALPVEQGRAALLPDGSAAALFRLYTGEVYAVGNLDPFSGAPVICHGIVGDREGVPVVTGPLGKEAFELATGRCLDDETVRLPVHEVRLTSGMIEVSARRNTVETLVGRG